MLGTCHGDRLRSARRTKGRMRLGCPPIPKHSVGDRRSPGGDALRLVADLYSHHLEGRTTQISHVVGQKIPPLRWPPLQLLPLPTTRLDMPAPGSRSTHSSSTMFRCREPMPHICRT
jgi:hypothetical protein